MMTRQKVQLMRILNLSHYLIFQKQVGKSRKGSKKSNSKKSLKGNGFPQNSSPDNLEHADSDVENCQIQSGKRSQNSFNQKGRAEDLDSKGEESGDDQQVNQMGQYKVVNWMYEKCKNMT